MHKGVAKLATGQHVVNLEINEYVETEEIRVKLLKIIKHTLRNTTYWLKNRISLLSPLQNTPPPPHNPQCPQNSNCKYPLCLWISSSKSLFALRFQKAACGAGMDILWNHLLLAHILFTWVEKGSTRVKCLDQEHNVMTLARDRSMSSPLY